MTGKIAIFLVMSLISLSRTVRAESWHLSAMDFDNGTGLEGHEADSLENDLGGAAAEEPEWHDSVDRSMKRATIGLSGGEFVPGASFGLSGLIIDSDREAMFGAVAVGKRTFSGQSPSGTFTSRRLSMSQLNLGFERWPTAEFPFAFVVSGGIAKVDGQSKDSAGVSYNYKLGLVSAGADLVMESFFNTGAWIRWCLISLRQYHLVTRDFGAMGAEARSLAASDVEGFKMTGIANLTVGYAW